MTTHVDYNATEEFENIAAPPRKRVPFKVIVVVFCGFFFFFVFSIVAFVSLELEILERDEAIGNLNQTLVDLKLTMESAGCFIETRKCYSLLPLPRLKCESGLISVEYSPSAVCANLGLRLARFSNQSQFDDAKMWIVRRWRDGGGVDENEAALFIAGGGGDANVSRAASGGGGGILALLIDANGTRLTRSVNEFFELRNSRLGCDSVYVVCQYLLTL